MSKEGTSQRPASIEDLLKRSVFSRCLRLLSQPDRAPERLEWYALVVNIRVASQQRAKRPRTEPGPDASSADLTTTSGDSSTQPVSDSEITSFISTYIREQLDLVTGLTMQVLTAPALHFFCSMLGCVPSRSKSKEVLFNALMNFYFTQSEPVGKRVSTNTFLQQEQAAMNAAVEALKPKPKPSPVLSDQPSIPQQKKVLGPLPKARGPVAAAGTVDDTPADAVVDILHVASHALTRKKVQPSTRVVSSVVAGSGDAGGDGFSREQLRKDVTTIVRCFDPITLETLVKKVEQLGKYPAAGCQDVENVVKELAAAHVFFVDCGVVFFEGS
jgi:hypothetical protein